MKATPLITVVITVLLAGCGLASERHLRQNFVSHRAEIEQIRQMQEQDRNVVRIAPGFTRLKNDWSWPRADVGISEQRWSQYRDLFKSAGIDDGTQVDEGAMFLFVSSEGLGISGAGRGYAYLASTPSVLANDFSKCPRKADICYIHLAGHWYLFQWLT